MILGAYHHEFRSQLSIRALARVIVLATAISLPLQSLRKRLVYLEDNYRPQRCLVYKNEAQEHALYRDNPSSLVKIPSILKLSDAWCIRSFTSAQ